MWRFGAALAVSALLALAACGGSSEADIQATVQVALQNKPSDCHTDCNPSCHADRDGDAKASHCYAGSDTYAHPSLRPPPSPLAPQSASPQPRTLPWRLC